MITMIGYFQLFAEPYVMTQGGPLRSTTSVVLLMYEEGFRWWHMGYAAAIAFVLFVVILRFTLVQRPLCSAGGASGEAAARRGVGVTRTVAAGARAARRRGRAHAPAAALDGVGVADADRRGEHLPAALPAERAHLRALPRPLHPSRSGARPRSTAR